MQNPPTGWYTVPGTDDIRWWDGAHWTAYRVAAGTARASWYAVEPPGVAYAFGGMFLALGGAQLSLALVSQGLIFSSIGSILLGAFWMSAAIALSAVRRRPAPASPAIAPDFVQPLPGQVEGVGAGWVPVTPRSARWWSGARWGEYLAEAGRVRPTFGSAKNYRVMRILAWVLLALGVVGTAAGIALLSWESANAEGTWVPSLGGVFLVMAGVAVGIVGLILIPLVRSRRRVMLLPEGAPGAVH